MPKIPLNAECVFKGEIFDVYQWEQELFDGSSATFECLKRPDTIVIIPIIDGKVCYAHQEQPNKPPFISLFGGRAEDGELPLETAKRELLEETGFESDEWFQFRKYNSYSKLDWNIYFFVAKNCHKVQEQSLDSGEKIEIKKTDLDTFFSEVVGDPRFSERELRNEIFSTLNSESLADIKAEILGLGCADNSK